VAVVVIEYVAATLGVVATVWVAVARYQPPPHHCVDCVDGPPLYVLAGAAGIGLLGFGAVITIALVAIWGWRLAKRGVAPSRGPRAVLTGTALAICGQLSAIVGVITVATVVTAISRAA
jgi:hypothetical protein